ncbi:MAG TPA: DUF72 domain-containing protein [bacterium (Candidatus Stahlbacteria)]|nr:DUF72 domain-containing protein [Candidatus Stahlbacteria bacterium]
MRILVGTSGFSYDHWTGIFYPDNIKKNQWLGYYTEFFPTVELNVTFYRLPKKETFKKWYNEVPGDFVFALKGSRFITHIKRIKEVEDSVRIFKEQTRGLGRKLEVILWQLPPQMKVDLDRFSRFIKSLRIIKNRHAFEFRHKTWFCDEVYRILKDYNHALCIADSPDWKTPLVVTADWFYLRFHGGSELYASEYSKQELKGWAEKIKGWKRDGYIYFNNDYQGFAVKNGIELIELLT